MLRRHHRDAAAGPSVGPIAGRCWRGHVPDCAGWGRLTAVRLTDFWERMEQVHGPAYAYSWAHDVVLPPLGMTVEQAIAAGIDTKQVWRAVCATTEVPGVLQ